ncbi:MAG TPA: serine hydrolase, partial [Halioglobus sp.]
LDDTIGSLLPEFRGTAVEKATLRQLLSHQAGMPAEYPGGRPTKGTLADFSKLIAERGSLRPPGTFNYSGVSIDIACRMAEVAGGVPIEKHLKSRVWLPLNMSHSDFAMAADPDSVSSAQRGRGEGRYVSCGGGMQSTLDDMANFYEMLLHRGVYNGKRLISEKLVSEMINKQGKNPVQIPYTTGEYGLALYRDRVAADGTPGTISHGGSLGTMPWADLDSGLVGVFFSQSRLRQVMPLIAEVQAEVRGEDFAGHDASGTSGGGSHQGAGGAVRRAGNQRSPEQSFNKISGGAEVINLKQFQEFVENGRSTSRLKGKPDTVERLFKRLDQNRDGVLDLAEYSKLQSLRR